MFYIPAMTYAFSENTGNSVLHSKRAIDYVCQHWPFFNRSVTGHCCNCLLLYHTRSASQECVVRSSEASSCTDMSAELGFNLLASSLNNAAVAVTVATAVTAVER